MTDEHVVDALMHTHKSAEVHPGAVCQTRHMHARVHTFNNAETHTHTHTHTEVQPGFISAAAQASTCSETQPGAAFLNLSPHV